MSSPPSSARVRGRPPRSRRRRRRPRGGRAPGHRAARRAPGRLLASLGPASAEHEVGAELGERLRELQPEPARTAGDQGDLAGEVEQGADVHGRLGSPAMNRLEGRVALVTGAGGRHRARDRAAAGRRRRGGRGQRPRGRRRGLGGGRDRLGRRQRDRRAGLGRRSGCRCGDRRRRGGRLRNARHPRQQRRAHPRRSAPSYDRRRVGPRRGRGAPGHLQPVPGRGAAVPPEGRRASPQDREHRVGCGRLRLRGYDELLGRQGGRDRVDAGARTRVGSPPGQRERDRAGADREHADHGGKAVRPDGRGSRRRSRSAGPACPRTSRRRRTSSPGPTRTTSRARSSSCTAGSS